MVSKDGDVKGKIKYGNEELECATEVSYLVIISSNWRWEKKLETEYSQ